MEVGGGGGAFPSRCIALCAVVELTQAAERTPCNRCLTLPDRPTP